MEAEAAGIKAKGEAEAATKCEYKKITKFMWVPVEED